MLYFERFLLLFGSCTHVFTDHRTGPARHVGKSRRSFHGVELYGDQQDPRATVGTHLILDF
jgi:hypothetical protein